MVTPPITEVRPVGSAMTLVRVDRIPLASRTRESITIRWHLLDCKGVLPVVGINVVMPVTSVPITDVIVLMMPSVVVGMSVVRSVGYR